MDVEEADRILQELWDKDVQAWDHYWVPIFRKFARDLVIDSRISTGNVVLDIGTGTGAAAAEIAKRIKAEGAIIGIDRSAPMIELAKQKLAKIKNASFALMNSGKLTFPSDYFDAVISNCGISYAVFHETISESFRALRKGGSISYNDWHLIDVPVHWKFSEILRQQRTENPSESLARVRKAVAIMEHVGNEYSDEKIQAEELNRVGFTDVQLKQRDYKIRLSGIQEYLEMRFKRESLKQELGELSGTQRASFRKQLRAGLRPFMHSRRLIIEWKVMFTRATKPV